MHLQRRLKRLNPSRYVGSAGRGVVAGVQIIGGTIGPIGVMDFIGHIVRGATIGPIVAGATDFIGPIAVGAGVGDAGTGNTLMARVRGGPRLRLAHAGARCETQRI
jgi:hypothetical protein